ncbi:expressed unknown protein [Seminavis robusta]|uniref:Uncharacterized protein n=1 Tax=Seminavis robusta TaxID=568900 RepID=A0A9N8E142_9STRA|nr:expressed unknown protein [Seminavis robusta]|eukprot:Sro443_g144050.1 n/a (258) ;mRNA; r:31443-32345
MADNWDDSDDDWDADDDEIDKKLGLVKNNEPNFADEEDLALKEKQDAEKAAQEQSKKKGNALKARKEAEAAKQEEIELAKRLMELEAEEEANMTPDQLRLKERMRIEQADNALTDDLFGGVDDNKGKAAAASGVGADKLVLTDLPSHLKHARKCAGAMRDHGKVYWTKAFIDELIKESKDTLDADAIQDIIKTCNVLKNEKVQAAKRKVKGQAQKASTKRDKQKEQEAQRKQAELFGDSNQYDSYDQIGEDYEDAFF